MATHALPSPQILAPQILADDPPQAATPAQSLKPTLMRRFYDALVESRRLHAQREIDRVLGRGGPYRRVAPTER